MIEEYIPNATVTENSPLNVLTDTIISNNIKCPSCGAFD
jgi:hypothetical protein